MEVSLSEEFDMPYVTTSAGEAAYLVHRSHRVEVLPAGGRKFQYRFHRRTPALYADAAAFHRGDLVSAIDYARAVRILHGLERTAERVRREVQASARQQRKAAWQATQHAKPVDPAALDRAVDREMTKVALAEALEARRAQTETRPEASGSPPSDAADPLPGSMMAALSVAATQGDGGR